MAGVVDVELPGYGESGEIEQVGEGVADRRLPPVGDVEGAGGVRRAVLDQDTAARAERRAPVERPLREDAPGLLLMDLRPGGEVDEAGSGDVHPSQVGQTGLLEVPCEFLGDGTRGLLQLLGEAHRRVAGGVAELPGGGLPENAPSRSTFQRRFALARMARDQASSKDMEGYLMISWGTFSSGPASRPPQSPSMS